MDQPLIILERKHSRLKVIARADVVKALDASASVVFAPGAAYTGPAQTILNSPPDSVKTTLPSLPLASYDSIYAAVNTNYIPGQLPATSITPGYNGATAAAEITASATSSTSTSTSTDKPLLSGTTLYAVIGGGGALVLIIIIIISVCCWRRKKAKKEEKWWKGKDDNLLIGSTGLESEKPSTAGHGSESKLNEQSDKNWTISPTSSIPEKNGDEFYHATGVDSARDELLGLGSGRKDSSRQGYQTDIYGRKPSNYYKGSPESTADSTTLAGSPPRQDSDGSYRMPTYNSNQNQGSFDNSSSGNKNFKGQSKDPRSFSPSTRLRYGSIDEGNNNNNNLQSQNYQSPSPPQSIHFDGSGGNYTDFMVRSPRRASLSSDGRVSPLPERISNRKHSIGRTNRKTDTILDFTDSYGDRGNVEEEDENDIDGSSWGASKRKRNLSLTNPFVPLPLLLSTSASTDSFPPPTRSPTGNKSTPRRADSRNDPRYGRIDSQPLHELESIVDKWGTKTTTRRDSRAASSSSRSPSLRALSLVPSAATKSIPSPPPVVNTPSNPFQVTSHPTGFNPSNSRSPAIPSTIVAFPDQPLPSLPTPIRSGSLPVTSSLPPSGGVLPIRRGSSHRIQPPSTSTPLSTTFEGRPRLDSNTSSSSNNSSRSPTHYNSSSARSIPSPNSERSNPSYSVANNNNFNNVNNFNNNNNNANNNNQKNSNLGSQRQAIPTIRSDWNKTVGERPSQESLGAMRARASQDRIVYGNGKGVGGGPIRTSRSNSSSSSMNQSSQEPTRTEPPRSAGSRALSTNLASVPESTSSMSLPPPPPIKGRQAVTRDSLSPQQRASMLPPEGENGRGYNYLKSIYGLYDS